MILLTGSGGKESVLAQSAGPPSQVKPLGGGLRRFSFPHSGEITKAEVYTWQPQTDCRAVLVLCPGFNGSGEGLVRQPAWQDFARANRLALCGPSFVSSEAEVRNLHGYIHAQRGSGDLLLSAIRQAFGRDLPILVYGFSCGGHLAISLADWQPDRVLGWCGYSASWWEEPQFSAKNFPPGIVACGEEDNPNYGTSNTFFAKGRAAGLPWTWVSLGHTGHAWSRPLDDFVRAYFVAILRRHDAGGDSLPIKPESTGGFWLDVDTKKEIPNGEIFRQPTLGSWLPDRSLITPWSSLHCP